MYWNNEQGRKWKQFRLKLFAKNNYYIYITVADKQLQINSCKITFFFIFQFLHQTNIDEYENYQLHIL